MRGSLRRATRDAPLHGPRASLAKKICQTIGRGYRMMSPAAWSLKGSFAAGPMPAPSTA